MADNKSTVQNVAEEYIKTQISMENLKTTAVGTALQKYLDDDETCQFVAGVLIAIMERGELSF